MTDIAPKATSVLTTDNTGTNIFPATNVRTQSPNDPQLAGMVRNLFLRARDKRRPLVATWNRNYSMLRNKYWTSARPTWMPRPEIAEIFPICASFVGWITDQRPEWLIAPWSLPYTPTNDFYQQLGDELGIVMRARWDDDDMEAEVEKIVWDSQIYGTGIGKVGWDNTLSHGLGDVILRRVDPYTFYPDPQGNSLEECNYFIEARTWTLQELDRKFPGASSLFSGGMEENIDSAPTQLGQREQMPMANPGAISPATVPRFSLEGQSRLDVRNYDDAGITVFECWIREHYLDKNNRTIDGWRCIVVAGNMVLKNCTAEEMWGHGGHPYERFVPYDLGEMWGLSLVELLTPAQETLNRLLSALVYNVELLGNPVFKESTRAGLSRQQMTNQPGRRITVNEGATAEWLQPPPLHEMIPELIQYFLTRMQELSGLGALNLRGASSGRNAQSVVDSMQEAGFVRVRMALRNLERFLRRCGTKVAHIIVEDYTEPRMMEYIGSEGMQSVVALKAFHFYAPTLQGESPMKFKLNVDVGAASQTSREARKNEAMTLFGLGAIDDAALLSTLDFPNWQIVWERNMKLKAQGLVQPPGARQRARS